MPPASGCDARLPRARSSSTDGSTASATARPRGRRRSLPAERLAAQQAQIARRLETDRTARPRHRVPEGGARRVRRPPPSPPWVTVAAAAGLMLGLVQVFQLRTAALTNRSRRRPRYAADAATWCRRHRRAPTPTSDSSLSEQTSPASGSRTLDALDDMTPPRVMQARNRVATQPLIFRKGLDMKEAVAGELAAAYTAARRRGRAAGFVHSTAGSRSISHRNSASATASIAPWTTRTRPCAVPRPTRVPPPARSSTTRM